MKLSQIKGKKAMEIMSNIMEPIGNIMADEEMYKMFHTDDKKNKKVKKDRASIFKTFSAMMKSHGNDLYAVLAGVEEKDVDKYIEETSALKLFNDFFDFMSDEASNELFINAEPEKEEK